MKTNKNSRGKITRRKYTKTITLNNGAAISTNEKVTKTFVLEKQPSNRKGRTLGEMVYESLNTPAYFAYMKRFESRK